MQQAFPVSLPGRQFHLQPRHAAIAALLVILLAMSTIGIFGGGRRSDDPVRLPAAMQVSPEESDCGESDGSLDSIALTGPTSHESVVMLPATGPAEGRPGVDAASLPHGGDPSDRATIEGVTWTVERLVACMNDGDAEGVVAWTSDDYWRRSNEIGIEINVDQAKGFAPLVSPVEGETPVPQLEDIRTLSDGRVGAVLRPDFDAPPYTYDYYVFIEYGGRWLVDEAVHVTEWATVEIVVTDEGFAPNEVTAPFAPARLVVRNEGKTAHSVVVPELGIRIEVSPGETGPSEPSRGNIKYAPGQYGFHSDFPGDDPDEFSGTLVIEGEPQATPIASPDPAP